MLGLDSRWRTYLDRMEVVIRGVEQKCGIQGSGASYFGGNARAWLAIDTPNSVAQRNTARL